VPPPRARRRAANRISSRIALPATARTARALYVVPGIKPPDLTLLSKNNGGVFPAEQVYQAIDGRSGIPAHSRIDMPFWGTTLQEQGKEFTPESEAKVKARISNMVTYIKGIQEK
jgi:hypothetical protein